MLRWHNPAMALPAKVRDLPGQPDTTKHLIDRLFFLCGTAAAVWLAWALLDSTLTLSWWSLLALVVFWLVLAYLALPRINRILASIYVPDYFIGRTRTSDGLLGDPLNLAFRGSAEQVATAMHRAGWTLADPVTLRSSVRIVVSTLTKRSYPEAPVSPLLLFGRQQDAAYQKEVDGNPGQRHHVRFWRTPEGWPLPGGHRVDWLAGGTYDRRVGLSLFTLQVTHKIDADIDVERDFIVSSVTTAEPAVTVDPLRDFTTSYHARNGGGDAVHTDGTLPVLQLGAVQPDPEAGDLRPHFPRGLPFQVLLPVLVSLLTTPLSLWSTIQDGGQSLEILALVLALGVLVSVVGVLRRSAVARRLLLLLALATVFTRITDYYVNVDDVDRFTSLASSAIAVLELLGLSSPAADRWTRRQ